MGSLLGRIEPRVLVCVPPGKARLRRPIATTPEPGERLLRMRPREDALLELEVFELGQSVGERRSLALVQREPERGQAEDRALEPHRSQGAAGSLQPPLPP